MDTDLASWDERYAAGKAIRSKIPRSSHGKWIPDERRSDPIGILEESNKTRLKNLVPIRNGRMSMSPLAFLRGSASVMASDLAHTPVSGIKAQLCGDAHLNNFGVYASPERSQLFDIVDFDETLAGPWEWDVKRLAASAQLAGRQNGYSTNENRESVVNCIRSYHEQMHQFAQMNHLDVWYFRIDAQGILEMVRGMAEAKQLKKSVKDVMAQATKHTRIQAFPKLTETVKGQFRIKDDPPLIYHYSSLDSETDGLNTNKWRALVSEYLESLPEERRVVISRYRYIDLAQKVVGVGSVGTICAIVLLLGGSDGNDPLFMQFKEAKASVLEPYSGSSPYPNHGQRVVVGQRMMQAASDVFLGWTSFDGRDYYARQLRDMKFSVHVETMDLILFRAYINLCAATLARAHARTGDSAQISGYLGNKNTFDEAVADFAEAYADQTERDHLALLTAIKEGRVEAQTGV